jgi:hypothetical protein
LAAAPSSLCAQEARLALIIGNADYTNIPKLKNPTRDARLIAQSLSRIGFETLLHSNTRGSDMRKAIKAYSDKLVAYGRNTIGLIYYAGHGIQVRENNYLLPVDADLRKESDAGIEAIHLADVLNTLFEAENKLNIVILDACRDNPYRKAMRAASLGLAGFQAPVGTLVAYSTGPGMTASDGEGDNSPFALALAAALADPTLKIEDAFKKTSERVYTATSRDQLPWFTTSVHGDFFLGKPVNAQIADAGAKRSVPTVEGRRAGGERMEGTPAKQSVLGAEPGRQSTDAEIEGRIAFFIEWKFFGSDNGARRLGPESYAEVLDYYGKVAVPRDQVLKDKDAYYMRWPNRRFSLLRETLQIRQLTVGSYDVRFGFKFDVESEKRHSVGSSNMSLGLRRTGNDFVILWQDEVVTERNLKEKPAVESGGQSK